MNESDSQPKPLFPPYTIRADEASQWAVLARRCRYQREPLIKLLQVSQRTLERYFKKHVLTTLGRWLRELQLRDAYQQIKEGTPLKEVVFAVGFKQASHFTRLFKGRFGILPSVLRGTPEEVLRDRVREAASITFDQVEVLFLAS